MGGFAAHQAMSVDRLEVIAAEWGICGVEVLPPDRKMADVMAAQNGLSRRWCWKTRTVAATRG